MWDSVRDRRRCFCDRAGSEFDGYGRAARNRGDARAKPLATGHTGTATLAPTQTRETDGDSYANRDANGAHRHGAAGASFDDRGDAEGKTYPGSELVIESTLEPEENYGRYIVSYLSEGNKIFALMTVPWGFKPDSGWPVIIFNHGYVRPDKYRSD